MWIINDHILNIHITHNTTTSYPCTLIKLYDFVLPHVIFGGIFIICRLIPLLVSLGEKSGSTMNSSITVCIMPQIDDRADIEWCGWYLLMKALNATEETEGEALT